MMSIAWHGFGATDSLSRTLIHFFPAPSGGVAPYPAVCELSIFGDMLESQTITLDGARLNQPDGVWLDDTFPQLKEYGTPVVGLTVRLFSNQARADVSGSGCVIEFLGKDRELRYLPATARETARGSLTHCAVRDAYHSSALVFVNSGEAPAEIGAELMPSHLDAGTAAHRISIQVPGRRVVEAPVADELLQRAVPQELASGLMRAAAITIPAGLPAGVCGYMVYRDASSRRIVSVSAL